MPEFVNNLLYVETNPVWMCHLFFLYSVVIFNSKLDHWLPLKKAVVKALSTHIPIFLKIKIFPSFLKKYTSPCSIFKLLFSPIHTKSPKWWKYDSIPYRTCTMLVVYDVWLMFDIIIFKNLCLHPSTCKQEACLRDNSS